MWPPSAAICCAVNHGVLTVRHFIRYTWGEMPIINVLLTVQIREKAKSDKGLVWKSEKGTSTKTFPLLCMMFSHVAVVRHCYTVNRRQMAESPFSGAALCFVLSDVQQHIKLTSLLLPICNISLRVSKSSTFGQERFFMLNQSFTVVVMWFYIITFFY